MRIERKAATLTENPGAAPPDLEPALDGLPEDERTTLVLRYYEGLTGAQVAGLAITPPLNWDGGIPLTVDAVSTETENGDTAAALTQNMTVTVNPVADEPVFNVTVPLTLFT